MKLTRVNLSHFLGILMTLDFDQLMYVLITSVTILPLSQCGQRFLSAFFLRGEPMNRSIPAQYTLSPQIPTEMTRKTAIHEAGHAVAIYIGNKEKKLPPVFFQIFIRELNEENRLDGCYCPSQAQNIARIEGGRLIHTLPSSVEEATRFFSEIDKKAYRQAFEADIINLLVGPLAEAKYVSLRDNELMNPRLINLHALHFYGGSADLQSAYEYLDCLMLENSLKEKKIMELFSAAYRFINQPANWNAISALADYILRAGKQIIDCEELIKVIEERLTRRPSFFNAAIGF